MTGFGSADGVVGAARVTVEVRSVNHRFFNPSVKMPSALSRWEGDVRDALRTRIGRGHVTASARIERDAVASAGINEAKFAEVAERLLALRHRYGLGGDVDVATVLRMPDVMSSTAAPTTDDDLAGGTAAELVAIVERAAAGLIAMRDEEGARLAAFLLDRLVVIEGALKRLAERAPARIVEQRDRLRAAVRELADGVPLDEQRVAMEIAVLADRLDVSEEFERFSSHIEAFRHAIVDQSAEPVGKRLGFLLQEMLREANTTGSKANDAAMLRDVVTIKEELERIREQVENVE
jgi:uncharacterized protein (TIGR00255 family)